jgi:hypothetical protein
MGMIDNSPTLRHPPAKGGPHPVSSVAYQKLLHKSPPVSLVTKRFVKLMGIFSGKPCVQSDAPDSSLGKVPFRSCNQRPTNSVAAHRTQYREGKNSAGGIVMLIAWIRDCTDHPAHFAIMHRHKRATAFISRYPLYPHLHLRFCCFVPKLAHQLSERRRIVHLGDSNRKI